MNKIFIILVAGILLFYFTSCSDDPNSVGSGLIPNKDELIFETIDSYTNGLNESFESFRYDSLKFGSSSTVLLGSYKKISSELLIGFLFKLPDSILAPLKDGQITLSKCWMQIEPSYWIGDSNNFKFSLHRINTSWNPTVITQDTIDQIHSTLGPNLFDESSYSYADSLMKFDLNKELVLGWIKRTYDLTVDKDYGMLLKPISNTGIVGFQALTLYPIYSYPSVFMVFEKDGVVIDTLAVIPSVDLHIPTGDIIQNPVQSILLQSTLAVRGKLWFDLSLLPENVNVNKATLNLYIDPLNTDQGTIPTDTIAVSFLTNLENVTLSSDIGKYRLQREETKYSGDIRFYVQKWADGDDNQGMQISLSDELRSVNKVGIYDTEAPADSLKPRLTIYYTKRK